MGTQKEYWDDKIEQWTGASYDPAAGKVPLLERMANLFRGGIRRRLVVALRVVGPQCHGKTVADMGCGLGDFSFGVLRYEPRQVIGMDISSVALRAAAGRAADLGVADRVTFLEVDVSKLETLPAFDIAVGLGFIDYLDRERLARLFRLLRGRYFLFSMFEKKLALINLLHGIYVRVKKCPGAFKYTRAEMREIAGPESGLRFLVIDGLLFVTNLPPDQA